MDPVRTICGEIKNYKKLTGFTCGEPAFKVLNFLLVFGIMTGKESFLLFFSKERWYIV